MAKKIRNFIYEDDKTSKFWIIEIDGKSYTVKYGKTGTNGQTSSKEFDSAEACLKAAEKVIKEKTGKGYIEQVTTSSEEVAVEEDYSIDEYYNGLIEETGDDEGILQGIKKIEEMCLLRGREEIRDKVYACEGDLRDERGEELKDGGVYLGVDEPLRTEAIQTVADDLGVEYFVIEYIMDNLD
jgi:predicted DNA-binding WGR domain protein